MPNRKVAKSVSVEFDRTNNAPQVTSSEVSLPELGRHGVLVQVRACGLSRPRQDPCLASLLPFSSKIPRVGAGHDVAGVVTAVGTDVTTLHKGNHVVGIVPLDYEQSGCSDYIVLQEFDVVLKPERVSFVDAAGCVGDAVRAYTALHYLGRLGSGDTVLVMDAASSFGSVCIQLAHHWGAKVLATASSADEKLYLESLSPGLSPIIELHHKNASLKSVVMMETGSVGVDIVVDQGVAEFPQNCNIYGENKQNSLNILPTKHDIISCLAVGGRWITSKANLQLDPPNSRLLYLRCASVGFLFEQAWMLSGAQQGKYQHILMDIMEKISNKIIRPNIHHTVAFDSVVEVIKSTEDLRVGKVVMVI